VSQTVEEIRAFIRSLGTVQPNDDLFGDDVDLFDYGYLDSFGIVGLIEAVEGRFGVDLSDVDFYEQGRTITGIAALLDKRRGAGSPT
jgi:acyl carrier protein